jgi:hypothetical protein
MIATAHPTRVRIDLAREALQARDELELVRGVLDEVNAQNARLTRRLSDARTRLECCPLCRFRSWLRSVTWRDHQ